MTETILPPDANRTETHPIPNGPAPRVSPDGSVQLLTRRRGSRELFPSSWLRTPAEVRHAGGITEGTLLEFCSTGLILQAKSHKVLVSLDAIHTVMLKEYGEWEGEEVTETLKTLETELGEVRTSIQKMAAGLRDLNNVPEVTWEDVGERDSRCLALPDMLAVAYVMATKKRLGNGFKGRAATRRRMRSRDLGYKGSARGLRPWGVLGSQKLNGWR